ncbi:SCO2400 family protein [Streptomyces lycopersici]|uniref:SCO2400 family protein n=1 Tax=Streptomyces lycopersici TaxID=2974589 RepID=UPI003D1622E6
MDYCSPCRRHLNGAVSCPGCGRPVEELGLPSAASEGGAGAEASATRADRRTAQASRGSGTTRASRRKPKSRGLFGRRARRARRGRGRRVAILASVLGPVLVAVFVAELATEGHWRESSPAPRRQEPVADRDGGVTESAETIVQDTTGPSAGTSAADGADGRPSKDKDKDGKKSKGEKDDTSPDPDDASSSAPSDDSPSAPGGSGATHRPTTPANPRPTAPATVAPTPSPTPTETCQRFLWWCT